MMGNSGRFTDGLLFGALLGGAAVFLLGTKKGQRVLKVLTEEGLSGFSEIAKEIENSARKETKTQLAKLEEKIEDVNESIEVEAPKTNGESHSGKPKSSKRFFKKTK